MSFLLSTNVPYFFTTWWGITITAVGGVLVLVGLTYLLYKPFLKAVLDFSLALFAIIVLGWLFILIAILIKATSPGPVFFKQKRVGRKCKFFYIHKFRTMRIDTPKDTPTHLLENPEQYITKIGRVLRKTSLDELPQIFDILRFKMSIIGPRPALYNQEDLVAERERHNANRIRPGLTGLAQVSGRDELSIETKAKVDGNYVKKRNLFLDIKIFFLTILKVFRRDGVVEGGTGSIQSVNILELPLSEALTDLDITTNTPKKILITGANSYIGDNVYKWLTATGHSADILDVKNEDWQTHDFSGYDTVLNVAGIAHDIGGKKHADLYYKVNCDLTLSLAQKAKDEGVGQFIAMSSMLVFTNAKAKHKNITKDTEPKVKGCYGGSKLKADISLKELQTDDFKIAIVRPPMIFGAHSKGNFPRLISLSLKAPVFPKVKNRRSMLYIDNLSEFMRLLIESGDGGFYYPQNKDYYSSSELTRQIARHKGKRLRVTRAANFPMWLLYPVSRSMRKLFGNLTYDLELSNHFEGKYLVVDNEESVRLSV